MLEDEIIPSPLKGLFDGGVLVPKLIDMSTARGEDLLAGIVQASGADTINEVVFKEASCGLQATTSTSKPLPDAQVQGQAAQRPAAKPALAKSATSKPTAGQRAANLTSHPSQDAGHVSNSTTASTPSTQPPDARTAGLPSLRTEHLDKPVVPSSRQSVHLKNPFNMAGCGATNEENATRQTSTANTSKQGVRIKRGARARARMSLHKTHSI